MKNFPLFLVMLIFHYGSLAQDNYDFIMIDGDSCGMHGNAKAEREYNQNPFKNRWNFPQATDIDNSITIEKLLQEGEDRNRFTQDQAVEITGYVYDVKVGGVETCNCKTKNNLFRDTHIEITPSATETTPDKRVIVEVTPRIRQILEEQGIDWSTTTLQDKNNGIIGRTVQIQGWLFYDFSHENEAFTYDPDDNIGKKNWRASCWEVHPITSIKIISEPEDLPFESDVSGSAPVFFTSTASITKPPKPTKPMTPTDYLILILLGGILGTAGQGIRVIVGLKKANETKAKIEYSETVLSLFIGFAVGGVAGVLAAVGSVDTAIDKSSIIAFLAAGYAGTDFIEGFMKKNKM